LAIAFLSTLLACDSLLFFLFAASGGLLTWDIAEMPAQKHYKISNKALGGDGDDDDDDGDDGSGSDGGGLFIGDMVWRDTGGLCCILLCNKCGTRHWSAA
jgi:hypothetical protein